MPKKQIITILILVIIPLIYALNAEASWSEPIHLSEDGVYPATGFGYPAITVDSNGTIHAFWIVSPSPDGSSLNRYSQIEYTRSTDGGITWTPTENLTPEYTTKRIYNIKAVCDSNNYVHLVYLRGIEVKDVLYKMFDGASWKPVESEKIGVGTNWLRMGIDYEDRVYATWLIGSAAYFSYRTEGVQWAEYARVDSGEYGLSDIKFDRNSLLFANATCNTTIKPYLFSYDKNLESWTRIEEMPNDTLTLGWALSISSKDTLHINNGYRTYERSKNIHLSMDMLTDEYTTPYEYGGKNAPYREMYIDSNDYLHLFELHYYSTDVMGIIHSTGKNKVWSTVEITVPDINYSYSEPNVAFDKINNKFYMVYTEFDDAQSTSRIFFHHKQNDTSIGAEEGFVADVHELYQNYPNPFNSSTLITYSVASTADVRLSVYNVKGELVKDLVNRRQKMGRYSIVFKADDLNSGIYFCKLEIDGVKKASRKMLNLK